MIRSFFLTLVSTVVFALSLPAQWSSFTTATNTQSAFWDNVSADGKNCNIGFVLDGRAGVASNCNNQRVAGWLPYTGVTPTQQYNTSTFSLFDNKITDATIRVYGDIAQQNQSWGVFFNDGFTRTRLTYNPSFDTQLRKLSPSVSSNPWGLWIKTTDGVTRYSDTDGQFAMFMTQTDGTTVKMFGLEDTFGNGSDRDFNDVVLSVSYSTVVPEPSTFLLMSAGLLMLGSFSRRRLTNTTK